jgi:branched-chain amino acid transport system permease protein
MAQYTLFIDPSSMFSWTEAVVFLLPAVIGGTRHWSGPVIGAILLGLVSDLSRVAFGASVDGLAQIIYGVVVIAVVMRARMGIVDLVFEKARARRATTVTDKTAEISNAAS